VPTVIVRSLLARTGAVLAALVILALLALLLVSDGPDAIAPPLATGYGFLLAVWTLWWAPEVRLTPEELVVRNAWTTTFVPWSRISHIGGRWGLEVILDDSTRVKVAAAPHRGGIAAGVRYHMEHAARAEAARRPDLLGSRVVREELLDGEGVHAVSLDASGAADLIEVYQERVGQVGEGQRRVQVNQPLVWACGLLLVLVAAALLT
jgi:hypothetical protein